MCTIDQSVSLFVKYYVLRCILLNVHVFIILYLYVKFWNYYVKLVISSVHYPVIVHVDHTGNKVCDLSCVIHGMDKCTLNSILCHVGILYLL